MKLPHATFARMLGADSRRLRVGLAIGLALWAGIGSSAHAQINDRKPAALEGTGVDEHLGDLIPTELVFRDDRGRPTSLAQVFTGERPVLLSLNYSDCPMLCRVQLDGLVRGLREMPWTAGKEFDVVSVSIDPLETPQRARQTKQRYLKDYGRPGSADGWRFLVGDSQQIAELANAVGFRFRYVPDRKEYVHAAVVMVCTPSGKISRYLYGVDFDPTTMRLSLTEASEGKVGSTLDQILLFCFHYDATAGRYGPAAQRLMQVAALAATLILAVTLVPVWLHRQRTTLQIPSNPNLAGQFPAPHDPNS